MKPKIKIRDAAFIPFGGKSCSYYGARNGDAPVNFEWDNSEPDINDCCFFTDTYIPRVNDYKCKVRIALPIESPPLRRNTYEYLDKHEKDFDVVLSSCRSYTGSNWFYRPALGSMIKPEDMRLYPKTKFCSMLYSNKTATPFHAYRHIIAPIAKAYGVDLMGSGVDGKEVNKLESVRDYSYSIVVEASSDEGFIGEKFYDCAVTGAIPIYFGPRFMKIDAPVCDDWVMRFWNTDVLREILQSLDRRVVQTMYNPGAIDAHNYSKDLPCVEDWLWEHYPSLFGVNHAK